MRIRRQLFLLQAATLGIVTAGAIGGWGISHWIGEGARRETERLALEREHLAHMSFDLLGAVPHTGQYLVSSPASLTSLIRKDRARLRRFREELDAHLGSLNLTSADPQLHRELETIRLLSVQVEQNLSRIDAEATKAQQRGLPPNTAIVESSVRDPSIGLIRRHSDQLAVLHESLDHRYEAMLTNQQRALWLGVGSWMSVLLAAWVMGLLMAWRIGDRLLNPLVQLEQQMRQSPQGMQKGLEDWVVQKAPAEIVSLNLSFRTLAMEVQRLVAELEGQLQTDELTTIGNRRHFNTTLEQEWERAVRSQVPLSLLLLDVDQFKQYNDHYGHIAGDRCLQQIAMALSGQIRRSSDVVCRIGGEEFAAVLPGVHPAEAARLAQAVVDAIDALAIEHSGSSVASWVTVSIGIAGCIPSSGDDAGGLIKRADAALYRRKQEQGRHGICLADPVDLSSGPAELLQ